jgi:hypothetical protein
MKLKSPVVLPLLAVAIFSCGSTLGTTLTVINTDDSGVGSLRQAIADANGMAGADMIVFNIPGTGQKTITLLSLLPVITETVTIDGGNIGDTSNRVELTGAGGLATGLDFETSGASNSVIRNLVINGFTGRQIQFLFSVTNCTIEGNFIGLNATGDAVVVGSGQGISMDAGCSGNLIGGIDAAARNVIGSVSDNAAVVLNGGDVIIKGNFIGLNAAGMAHVGGTGRGISINNALATVGGTSQGEGNVIASFTGIDFNGNPALGHSTGTVQGNFIGTDATGMTALNFGGGVGINVVHATGVVINGGNVISGNGDGININSNGISGSSSDSITVQGNFIGTAADGVTPVGNSGFGLDLFISSNNVVGGTNSGEGNVIAFNGQAGLRINLSTNCPVQGNSIYANGELGIDLVGGTEDVSKVTSNDLGDADTGSNNLQNFPVIDDATVASGDLTITGTLNSEANKTYRLEFFASPSSDPSGHGEGETFLGFEDVTTDANGDASFNVVFAVAGDSRAFAATATDPDGNTSEFSATFVLPIPKLLNISTRMQVLTDDNVLIGGFIVTGISPKKVIVRAIGPSLTAFGVPGALMDPTLELNADDGSVTTNDNWKDSQQVEIEATGLQPTNDAESAILQTLAPGAYTAIVRGVNGTTGVGLVEAYDLDQPADSELANISTRGFIDTGANVMIGGLIIGPDDLGDATVLVRAIGPSLENFGVANAIQDPVLELHSGNGDTIATNDDWRDTQETEIIATGLMPTDDRESASLQTLAPGNYTAIVRGVDDTTGVGLVEAYHLQ